MSKEDQGYSYLKKKKVLFHTFNLERVFFNWNKLRNSIYACFIKRFFFDFCEGYTPKSSTVRFCVHGQNEFYCCSSVFPGGGGGGGGKHFVRNVIIEINNVIMKIKWRMVGSETQL